MCAHHGILASLRGLLRAHPVSVLVQAHKTPADYAKEQEKRANHEMLELLGEDAPLHLYKDGTHPVE